ncbi:MAG: hypothetical protein ACR2OZ_15930 [Verrucomicrobiales bacterium]
MSIPPAVEDHHRRATIFAEAALGRRLAEVDTPTAKFGPERLNKRGFYGGAWVINWQRTTSDGAPFVDDFLFVKLDDRNGPYIIRRQFNCEYQAPKSRNVDSHGAKEIALAQARTYLREHPEAAGLRDYQPTNSKEAKLVVVEPTFSTDRAFGKRRPGRLSWQVYVEAAKTAPKHAHEQSPALLSIYVYVDVENRACLRILAVRP